MKKYFLFFFLYANIAFSQDESVEIKFAPTLTEMGKPIGEKVTQQIDKNGGRIISPDKKMELIIPQDAVSKKTDISIQSVENTLLPGGNNSYHLEPSGISFQKPLQIIFHYSQKESPGEMPDLRNIAWQDDKGQWFSLDSSIVDTAAKTVTGNITHFSTWVFFDYFNLTPISARVKVGKKLQLQIVCVYPGGLSDQFKNNILKQMKFSTYVNSIRNGNAVVGTASSVMATGTDRLINYTAPVTVPDNNPVALSVEASNVTFNRKNFSKIKLVSNIVIFDGAYDISVKGFNEQAVLACKVSSIDSSTCTLYLEGKRSRLDDIVNMNVVVNATKCKCPVEEINKGNNIGAINIEGAFKIEVIPQEPFKVIRVYFIKAAAWLPGWHAPPCGHTNDVVTPLMALPALPFFLSWEDDGKEHLMKGGDDKNGFEIRVKPVKGDQYN
jgi:hypothetical protein